MLSVDQCRDKLAVLAGWTIYTEGLRVPHYLAPGKHPDADCQVDHPIPATLDAAAAAMPEWWTVIIEYFQNGNGDWVWAARARTKTEMVCVSDRDTEEEARFNLALLAREKGKSNAN